MSIIHHTHPWRRQLLLSVLALGASSLASVHAASDDARYLSYSSALTQISDEILSKRNEVRERFPYNASLFDSKNVPAVKRREFAPPPIGGHDSPQLRSGFKPPPPGQAGGVLTRDTGGGNTSQPKIPGYLDDTYDPGQH